MLKTAVNFVLNSCAMSEYPRSPRSTIRRLPKRARYDRDTVHAFLDAATMGHLAFLSEGKPVVIPTAFGREGDTLYFHGASVSRLMTGHDAGADACFSTAIQDGWVLARSLFHHSLNYRSVVAFGSLRPVSDPKERDTALRCITRQLIPGRWEEARHPNPKEEKATSILALDIREASAKTRSGNPVDDPQDAGLPEWAGVVPLMEAAGTPVPVPGLPVQVGYPASLWQNLSGRALAFVQPDVRPVSPPDEAECAPYYHPYIRRVGPEGVVTMLSRSLWTTPDFLMRIPEAKWDFAYAPGKWSVRELILHILDTERIMGYRLLRISRGDTTPLPGFDEVAFAANGHASSRDMASLGNEFRLIRMNTLQLLSGLPDDTWTRSGIANGFPITVRALAFVIAGHEHHHLEVLKNRYLERS